MRMLIWLLIIVGIGFLGFGLYLYFGQSRMVFFPTRELAVTPDQVHLPFEEVNIQVDERVRLHGWYFSPPDQPADSARPVVLFCHGNAGNISHRLETVDFLLKMGTAILLFDYRGYGQSSGSPTEQGVYDDAAACYHWLREEKHYEADRIVVFGRSLGGAVAVDLAAKNPCCGLIVESSFTSARDMARQMFPFFPVQWLLRYDLNSLNKISSVGCPVLVTHSPDDDLVPYTMGQRLYAAASVPKRFVELAGSHNDREYFGFDEYRTAVADILSGGAKSW